ncbi:MAG: OmpA family protein [Xanthomonadales bacterium]|nr:OmpA family protein [Xanthomonadales bacterium]
MSEFDRLRDLLLAPEHVELERLRANEESLPQRLPDLLDAAERGERREALHRALAPVVAAALTDAVRHDRRRIVDALFPVIGPAIRRAIAEALRSFVGELNRALEHSLTPRGIGWRIESWRSGVPFAQVVMKHSLRYRIDHLFLIERESGLLLYRRSAPELPELDADAIAGMLTAIADFVRDSVRADGDAGLASATVGEHLLQVHEGPRTVLACFIRGVPPPELGDRLRAALEDLHRGRDALAEADAYDWDAAGERALDVHTLEARDPVAAPGARWPVLLLAALLLALAASWGWGRWQRAEEGARLRAALAATPGWELLELRHAGRWRLRALRDPDAISGAEVLAKAGVAAEQVEIEARAFLALDPVLVGRRAQRILAPPAGVELTLDGGRLSARGQASADWVRELALRAPLIPGVSALDTGALATVPEPDPQARLRELIAAAEALELEFARGRSEPDPAAADAIAVRVRAASDEADRLGLRLRIRVYGWSDDSGGASLNARLRERRADVLREVLVRHGIDSGRIEVVVDDDRKATRAGLRLEPVDD